MPDPVPAPAVPPDPAARPKKCHDTGTHRLIVGFVGLIATVATAGIILLALYGKETPPALTAAGSAAGGALASLIASLMNRGDV